MERITRRWPAARRTVLPVTGLVGVLVTAGALGGCSGGGSGAGRSSAAPTAEPIADCVTLQEQAASGVHVVGTAGQVDALVLGARGTTGIVFANMSDNDPCGWLPTATGYAAQGYRTAVFVYSSRQGADADVLDVAAELRRRGATRIALVGASKGGTSVISAAARAQAVAVVELSAPQAYEGLDAVAAVKSLTVPTLFVVGDGDTEFVAGTDALHSASPATVKPLRHVTSGAHGTGLLADSGVGDALTAFLTAHAPPTP